MPSPIKVFDARATWQGQKVQILVEADTYELARELAMSHIESVYPGAVLDWVTEYPRAIRPRPSRALMDD